MSLQALRAQPRTEPIAAPVRRLQAVPEPDRRRRPKLAYALLAVGGALAIGAAQMGLSLAATQDSFVLAELTAQQRALTLEKQALSEEIVALSSPQSLASKADALGLVVAGSASYLRLSDGVILGASQSADGRSTVNPNGPSAVGNALLAPEGALVGSGEIADSTAQDVQGPIAPPALSDGLPTPTTR
ncbi:MULTISPECIES: hypothetical protein [Microbacterium]|uniref:hypothetical protein n=1 Tax=Microbacterium TaxID=33882 RepID=UPI00217EDC5C|nr:MULTISPECIES: hypothetical protein [Microbacterium]UWF76781.1 hypothetical protein JSY13_07890 [Microbacterium neungamense]WCM54931.1 hypothetical protein JRG78_07890 [Microbacterium sp. EF45047]